MTDHRRGAADSSVPGWWVGREARSILGALSGVAPQAHVLDLPCGTGRLAQVLLGAGYRVTCADRSEQQVQLARRRWEQEPANEQAGSPRPTFAVCDVMQTEYPDRHFDAVVCNRLFHQFRESEVRIRALRELRRITKGPVVVSFDNVFSLGALRVAVWRSIGRTAPDERKPIPAWTFFNDIRRAGLTPIAAYAVLWGLSPMWHVVSVPAAGRAAGFKVGSPALRAKAG